MSRNILFVCTGNTCRSPFAEGVMKKLLWEKYGESASEFKVSSAGTYAYSGVSPTRDALDKARDMGVDLSDHRSRSIHLSIMEAADTVFCMAAKHKAFLIARFPWFEEKIFVLKEFTGTGESYDLEDMDVRDPIGGGPEVYREVFEEIKDNVQKVLDRWEEEKKLSEKTANIYRVAIASDHAGYGLKEEIGGYLEELGHEVEDFGAEDGSCSVDYPDFAKPAAKAVAEGKYDMGILVCGSGVGMSISANRIKGVRAVLAREALTAKLSRAHNNSNVLCLGERFTTFTVAKDVVKSWLKTPFEGGRHKRRIDKIEKIK